MAPFKRETETGQGQTSRNRYLEKIKKRILKTLPSIPDDVPVIDGDKDTPITITVPDGHITLPRFIPEHPQERNFGQGDAKPGDILAQRRTKGVGQGDGDGEGSEPGREAGEHDIVITATLDELRQWIMEDLKLPNMQDKKNALLRDNNLAWTSLSRTGSLTNIDKKQTLKQALLRSLEQKKSLSFTNDDLRYKTWVERDKPKTAAVVYLLRDASGSITDDLKYLSRALGWYLVTAIRMSYSECPVSFWIHDIYATEVNETEWFHTTSAGGTAFAQAYQQIKQHMDINYPDTSWNRYLFHFTDGETWDIGDSAQVLASMMPTLSLMGVALLGGESLYATKWIQALEGEGLDIPVATVRKREDVVLAIRKLLGVGGD